MIRFRRNNTGRRVRALHASILLLTGVLLAGCQQGSRGVQPLVDRAALTVQEIMTQPVTRDPRSMLRQAKAVMICPQVFKAGFFVGGEGGSCVMLARSGNGTWSYPAFYDVASGSFGFQFGIQDSQLLLLIMTERGLNAVMDSQVRLGANLSVAVASVGGGVQGATTAAVGADILAFAEARGLFGGVSLDGGVMSSRTDENQAYYGQPFGARQIVLQMQGVNPGADPLREVLTRYGGAEGAPGAYQPPAQGYTPPGQPSYSPPAQTYAPTPQPAPAYQPAPQSYSPPASSAPAPSPGSAAPASGYQPPPGQYTYPPAGGASPIQQQPLPPPGR